MKRIITALVMICFVCPLFTACGDVTKPDDKFKIVCTVFPVYDWVRNIIGENDERFELNLLGNGKQDLHSFQPSARDIASISECDMFIYLGTDAEMWVEKALQNSRKTDICAIRIIDLLDEEDVLGGHNHQHGSEDVFDEHIWLSFEIVAKMSQKVSDELATLDTENGEVYKKNSESYKKKLKELDEEYKAAVLESDDKTIIVADRFPLLHLCNNYGIKYYAAFHGCSADTEVSFETIVKLAEAADSLEKKTLLVTENSDTNIASSVIGNMETKDVSTVVFDSCQSVADIENSDYMEIMKNNLVSLKKALE